MGGCDVYADKCAPWISTFVEWAFAHWYVCLLGVVLYCIAWVICTVLQEAAEEAAAAARRKQSSSPARDPAAAVARQRKLDEITSFTEAVIAVQGNNVLNATDKETRLAQAYSDGRRRLDEAEELTSSVEHEFKLFAEHAVESLTGLTVDFGASLDSLIRTYDGPAETFTSIRQRGEVPRGRGAGRFPLGCD